MEEMVDEIVSEVMKEIKYKTKFWSFYWKGALRDKLIRKLEAHLTQRAADVCQTCGSQEIIGLPEDETIAICGDCGTRR